MKRSAKTSANQAITDKKPYDESLTELQEQLFWVILRCREKARSMCEEAGYTPEEAGLQFNHPMISRRRRYSMICLRM